jgi:hypothetical protein
MKAVIEKYATSHGEQIQILGAGVTERKARINAFEFIGRNYNQYKDRLFQGCNIEEIEYQGGECVDLDPVVVDAMERWQPCKLIIVDGLLTIDGDK